MFFVLSIDTFAYFGPGVGSSLMQGILAIALVFSTGVVIVWNKLKKLFSPDDDNDEKKE